MGTKLWSFLVLLGLIGIISALPAIQDDEETNDLRDKRHLRLAVNKYINLGGSPPIKKKIIGYNWNKIIFKNGSPLQYQNPIFCLEHTPEQLAQLSSPPKFTTSPLLKLPPPATKIVPLYPQAIQIPSPPKLFYQIPVIPQFEALTKMKPIPLESIPQTPSPPAAVEGAPSTEPSPTVYETPIAAPAPTAISTVYGPPAQGFPILQQPVLSSELLTPILDLPSPPPESAPASDATVVSISEEVKSPAPSPAPAVPVFSFEQVIGKISPQPVLITQAVFPKPYPIYASALEPLPQFNYAVNYVETPKQTPVVPHFQSSDCLETLAFPQTSIPSAPAATIPIAGYPQYQTPLASHIQPAGQFIAGNDPETPASTFPLNLQPQPAFQPPLPASPVQIAYPQYKEEISAIADGFIAAGKYPETPSSTFPLNLQPQPAFQPPLPASPMPIAYPQYKEEIPVLADGFIAAGKYPETPASTFPLNLQPQPAPAFHPEYIPPSDDGSLPINPILSPAGTIPAFGPQYQPIAIPDEKKIFAPILEAPASFQPSAPASFQPAEGSFSNSGLISPAGTIPLGAPVQNADVPVVQEVPEQILQAQEVTPAQSGGSVIQCYQCSPISFVPEGQQVAADASPIISDQPVEEKLLPAPSPLPIFQNIELPKFDYPYPPAGVKA